MTVISRLLFTQLLVVTLALALALAAAAAKASEPAPTLEESTDSCAWLTAQAERSHGLPAHLLTALSKIESGRWHAASGEVIAWPWTVTAGGEGRFLPTKKAAIAEVERLRARGVRNIDVGCMQVNLRYHPRAFKSLEEAFDPARNVAYATRFLVALKARWGSWTRAMGNYHSNTPTLSGRYRLKVFRAIYAEKRLAAKSRRSARLAALEVKRAAAGARSGDRGSIGPPNATPIPR